MREIRFFMLLFTQPHGILLHMAYNLLNSIVPRKSQILLITAVKSAAFKNTDPFATQMSVLSNFVLTSQRVVSYH